MDDVTRVPFDFETLFHMTQGRLGQTVVACPLCGPERRNAINRRRRVLALHLKDENFIGYNCFRCGAHGFVKDDGRAAISRSLLIKPGVEETDRSQQASDLWSRTRPVLATPVELYLRKRRCFIESPNIRFLPGHGVFHHAMVARFASRDGSTRAIHMTKLNSDGSKATTSKPKIMLGKSMGWPIIVSQPDRASVLFVTEGVEDACSIALVTQQAVWAAGSSCRVGRCVAFGKRFNRVVVAIDPDEAGEHAYREARQVRQDAIAIRFDMGGEDEKLDANRALIKYGADAVRDALRDSLYA